MFSVSVLGVGISVDCIFESISCRCEGKAIKWLHGAHCAESFGRLEAANQMDAAMILRRRIS